jgi:hypothetical protein
MGDRGEIVIQGPEYTADGDMRPVPFEVYLYTHNGGSDLPLLAAVAIDKAEGGRRLGDLPYFARVCLDTLSTHCESDTRGVGISNSHIDGYKAVHYRKRRSESGHNITVEISGYDYIAREIEGRQMGPAEFADTIAEIWEGDISL